MKGACIGRWTLACCALAIGLTAFAVTGYAQAGRLMGKVLDANNKPIEGATITMLGKDTNRKSETKTNRNGEYATFLQPGQYTVTATKDNLSQTFDVKVGMGERTQDFTLKPGSSGGGTDAERKKQEAELAAVNAAFSAGVALSNEGKFDEAIAKYNEVLAKAPKCAECYGNIGTMHARKKEYEQAEAAFKKALELNPNSVDAYNGLANVYNSMGKFDLAKEASAQARKLSSAAGPAGATGGGNAAQVYTQGVIALNGKDYPEAKKLFEEAVALDPKLADAQYQLGMAWVREGKFPEAVKCLEEYLKLEPNGTYAKDAKSNIEALKPLIKK
jgi:tetratricopeptide (TPR) repeat protein